MRQRKLVKRIFPILASLALNILLAVELSSCGKTSSEASVPAAPLNEVDIKLNDYEKVSNELARVAKQIKEGDVSVAVRYLELGKRARAGSATLQQESAKMTPPQAERLASISAKTAPYLQE
jgi:hypothetical protein